MPWVKSTSPVAYQELTKNYEFNTSRSVSHEIFFFFFKRGLYDDTLGNIELFIWGFSMHVKVHVSIFKAVRKYAVLKINHNWSFLCSFVQFVLWGKIAYYHQSQNDSDGRLLLPAFHSSLCAQDF